MVSKLISPALLRRLFFFVVGGLVSFLLNLIPYKLLTLEFHWTHNPAYAVSLTFVTLLMFFWNYRVNFPTTSLWHDCAWRYLTATAVAWTANFLLVGWLKAHLVVAAAIFVVGFVIALFKFVLYHSWVFPHRPTTNELPTL
ncbi:MAG: GtrA family protein [Chthoniobacterales bacterium]